MPTIAERLATLESLMRGHSARLERIEDALDGGGDVEYPRSVRGRLHKIEGKMATTENLAQAAREMRRSQGQKLSRWVQVVIVLCGVVTAAAAVVGAIAALVHP